VIARAFVALAIGIVLSTSGAPVVAGPLSGMRGHMSLGYSKAFLHEAKDDSTLAYDAGPAPGGSLSVGAGLDVPVAGPMRAGIDIAFHLLGSRTAESGSLLANVDYSAFQATLFAHWLPTWKGPVRRLSAGPALVSARGELSTSGGGLAFSPLAVEEVAPAAAFAVTLLARSEAPVRVGLEASACHAFLEGDDWTLASLRLAFHY